MDEKKGDKACASAENEPALALSPDDALLDRLEATKSLQKVAKEGLLIAGGASAILLQVAMPGVAKGVDEHSNFANRPLRRLDSTMTFIYCMTFGSKEEKRAVIEAVHKAHASVRGADYSADDPELQMWVAATLYATGIFMYEEAFGALEASEADEIYREWSVMAESLRVPSGVWPKDRNAFWEYWDDQVGKLEITPHAQRVADDLLYNKRLPLLVRPFLPMVRLTTTYMLPDSVREGYGLKKSQFGLYSYKTLVLIARLTYPALPDSIRLFPMKHYLGRMRSQMASRI